MNAATSPFDPVTIGPLTLRNRFIKSGANEAMCLQGVPTRALLNHHSALARGGVGMTTVAYMAVAPEARTLPNQIWMRPAILPDLRALTAAVHLPGRGHIGADHPRGLLRHGHEGERPHHQFQCGLQPRRYAQGQCPAARHDRG
ncbi:MAG: hypothetical protein R3E50_07150 [Halioglobus sp.]